MFGGQTEPQLVPKLLLQVSIIELYNSLVSNPNGGGLKDARDEDDNIIISDSTLSSLLPPQLKQISARYKVMCGYECYISAKNINSSLLSWRNMNLKNLKDKRQNAQIRSSGEKLHHIYETYKNTVMSHGRHIYAKESDMEKSKMCTYPQSDHALTHYNFVLRCCDECPHINLPDQKTD